MRIFIFLAVSLVFSTHITANVEEEIVQASCLDLEHLDNTTKSTCDKGDKPFLILEFFSAGCSSCRRNVPFFKQLESAIVAHASSRLISLNPREEAQRFKDSFQIATTIALDPTGAARQAYGISHVPSIFVLNQANQIVFKYVGVLNQATINRIVKLIDPSATISEPDTEN